MLPARISKERTLPIKLYQRDFVVMFHLHNSLIFCLLGFVALTKDLVVGLQTLAFFGSCAAIFVWQLYNHTPTLRLDYGGFTTSYGAHQKGIPVAWASVDKFVVVKTYGKKRVGWRYTAGIDHQQFWRPGPGDEYDATLPYRYGVSPKRLAALMNELCRCYRMTDDYLKSAEG